MISEPTVFIIDDDPAVRRLFAIMVQAMRLRPMAYGSAQAFLDDYDPSSPGCVLLEVRLPGIHGLELLERLVQDKVHPPVIIVSAYGDVPMVVRAMKAGAIDFLEKPCREQQLWEAIQEALKWDADNRKVAARRAKIELRLSRLTEGEREVLKMLLRGMSNKAIAAELGLSVRTIEVRRSKVMQKMKATSLAELVRLTLIAEDSLKAQS